MSTALALPAAAQPASLSRVGSGMAVQALAGSVSAFFTLESFDRRRGVAVYALRVVNRTMSALVCRTWVVSHSGDAVLAYPVLFEVEPLSTSTAQIPVWPNDFSSFDRAIAEVAGDGIHCLVEACAPVRARPQRPAAVLAVASLIAVMLVTGIVAAVRASVPRIAALAVPPEVLAGTTIRAQYDVFGAGRLAYTVAGPDGRRLQGGTLSAHSGAIPIAIPTADESGAYTLQMAMAGPLGNVAETRVINAIPAKGPGSAQIEDVAVTPVVAKPGQQINVVYAAAADDGYVRLLGTDGTIWAQRPFSHDGQTHLVIPAVPGLREMRVLVHVNRGSSSAQSMAGLVVASPSNEVSVNAPIVGDDDPGSPAAAQANGTFEALSRTVRSGLPIRVHILSPRNGMRIALTDAQSREVSSVSVGAEADTVALRAPAVTVATRYTIVASFSDGFGQESVVQPVTILP